MLDCLPHDIRHCTEYDSPASHKDLQQMKYEIILESLYAVQLHRKNSTMMFDDTTNYVL